MKSKEAPLSEIKASIMSTAVSMRGEESIFSTRFFTSEKNLTGFDTIILTEEDLPKVEIEDLD